MRVIILVLDGVGCGNAPDANVYGDVGSNTLGNVAKQYQLTLPNLTKLGLGHTTQMRNVSPVDSLGAFGILTQLANGKDSTTGHWEIAGYINKTPFPVFPDGFPKHVIEIIENVSHRKCIGNCAASGTKIIEELGELHQRSGDLIVYTSADSVLQIAAHEEIVPLHELYRICETLRDTWKEGPFAVGRVIARPFLGTEKPFYRTTNRHDWALSPKGITVLDELQSNGIEVTSIGKVIDLFNGQGFSKSIPTKTNADGIAALKKWLSSDSTGLVFANLIDFDQLYGHRNDIVGFANALEKFDTELPLVLNQMKTNDVLFITADHGNDPTTISTDHSRERVPLLIYGEKINSNVNIGIRKTFADVAKTISDMFQINSSISGISFWKEISK